uniref:Reverse transcriptase domain-containing protein n=1 Tax=Tanacetum cinerariifolium TaxID=118510 RepID=A0A6L2KJQ3_TANCI|nr:hypothetical protein [Tanacetum cinerariifolium]
MTATVGQRRSTPPANGDQCRRPQSTVAGHGGDRRSTMAVNDGQRCRPPVNGGGRRWRTTVDCRWTIVDHHRSTVVGGPVNERAWAGSGSVRMSDDRVFCRPSTCERCRRNYADKFCSICCFESGNEFIDDLIANSFDDLLNSSDLPPQHQTHSFESYNDNPNYSYPPQEPFVYNQDSCYEQNIVDNSQSPPQPQYEMNSYELCGNDGHYSYDCPPQVPFVYNQDPCFNQDFDNNFPQTSPSFPQQYLCCENCAGGGGACGFSVSTNKPKLYNSNSFGFDQFQPPQYPVIHHPPPQETSEEILQAIENLMQSIQTFLRMFNHISFRETPKELAEYINSPSWNHPAFYDDEDEYFIQVIEFLKKSPIAIAPVLPIEDPDNSLSMGDEHLSTIPKTESNEVIKSSVEDVVPIPNTSIVYSPKIDSLLEEFAGELVHISPIPPRIDETDSDLKDDIRFIEQLLYDDTLSEDDSFEDIDYVEGSPPDSELVSLEEVKEEIICAKLLNIHLLIAMIESLNKNPTPDCVLNSTSLSFLSYTDNSSPKFENFIYHTEETSSSSTTTHSNNSLFEYDTFLFEIEPDQGELISVVMNDISDNSTNDPFMEEIDLFLASDNSIPPCIKNVDYDSEGDILFLEELLRMIPFRFLSLNHFILIFMMIHHLLVLWKNHR